VSENTLKTRQKRQKGIILSKKR